MLIRIWGSWIALQPIQKPNTALNEKSGHPYHVFVMSYLALVAGGSTPAERRP